MKSHVLHTHTLILYDGCMASGEIRNSSLLGVTRAKTHVDKGGCSGWFRVLSCSEGHHIVFNFVVFSHNKQKQQE